jgi:anti-sigma B factor antagonist
MPVHSDDQSARGDQSSRFQLRELASEGTRTLLLSGEVDLLAAPDLEAAVGRLCVEGTVEIVLDLSRVSFMDSTGLRATLSARELCDSRGYRFSLVPGPPQVQSLFDLTGLTELLPFQASEPSPPLPDDAILPKLFAPSGQSRGTNTGGSGRPRENSER